MRIPGRDEKRTPPGDFAAAENAGRQEERATRLLEAAVGIEWYEQNGTAVDEAALALCRLRRAEAGLRGGPEHGDAAVRRVLDQAGPEAAVWLASRAISYMDETGFAEAVEPWFPGEEEERPR